ncbi:hypothetical protein CCHOA_04675 [Corynebacterium choanae]|uniref:Uncharacterized protein n=1 Tax=Corynebacterium choanae TaxID=1862358 RepID=A0A3G6J6F0_9CORY|nr:hypothetical protein CCHOA_04675 [Corynebacterium choanae]
MGWVTANPAALRCSFHFVSPVNATCGEPPDSRANRLLFRPQGVGSATPGWSAAGSCQRRTPLRSDNAAVKHLGLVSCDTSVHQTLLLQAGQQVADATTTTSNNTLQTAGLAGLGSNQHSPSTAPGNPWGWLTVFSQRRQSACVLKCSAATSKQPIGLHNT